MDTQNSKLAALILLFAAIAADDAAGLKKFGEAALDFAGEQEKQLEEAVKFNDDLQKQLEAAQSGVKYVPSIKIYGKTYNAVHAVYHEGKKYLPKDIVENEDLAEELIDGNSSALELQPVTDEEAD